MSDRHDDRDRRERQHERQHRDVGRRGDEADRPSPTVSAPNVTTVFTVTAPELEAVLAAPADAARAAPVVTAEPTADERAPAAAPRAAQRDARAASFGETCVGAMPRLHDTYAPMDAGPRHRNRTRLPRFRVPVARHRPQWPGASLLRWSVVRYCLCLCVARHQWVPAAANRVLARTTPPTRPRPCWTTVRSATNWCTSSPRPRPARCIPTIRWPRRTWQRSSARSRTPSRAPN